MKRAMREIKSIVNSVCISNENSQRLVFKKYKSFAKETGVLIPIERYLIEARVLMFFEKSFDVADGRIRVPKLLNCVARIPMNVVEYVHGREISSAESKISMNLTDIFLYFGKWLRHFEVDLYCQRLRIFDNLWDAQEKICEVLTNYKGTFDSTMPPQEMERTVSLGDVGLKNLLFSKSTNSIYIFDFEFAHISVAGRDAGQLLAQLQTLNFPEILSERLIEGYVFMGGELDNVKLWKNSFISYYLNKKN